MQGLRVDRFHDGVAKFLNLNWTNYFVCVGVMYSGQYGVCDVTLSIHPHRASWKVCLATVGIELATFGILVQCSAIVNISDMVWKPFVLGGCVPCAWSRLKNPLSFYCLTIVSSESLAKGMGTKCLFCLPWLYFTAYFANNEVLPPFFDG